VKRAVIYLRVSTDEQVESRLGLEAQEAACRQFCEKEEFEVAGVFVDAGVSGKTLPEEREGFMEALSALKRGSALVVAKRDRLARDRRAIVTIELAVRKKRALILSASGEGTSVDDSDPFSIMFSQMIDVFSEFERGMISHRTKAALQAKRDKGQRVSHRLPYGYRLGSDGIHLDPDPEEQTTLKRMRELRSSGLPYRSIATQLTREGFLNRASNPWQHASLHLILTRKPIRSLETKNETGNKNDDTSNLRPCGVGTE